LFYNTTKENIVAYSLKAKTVEQEKQPLLAIGSEKTFVSRQLLGKKSSRGNGYTFKNRRTVGSGVF
jgi:hypothetical protein